jgi:hypothetical protein
MQGSEPRPTDLATATGISVPYASQIVGGTRRPARSLAIVIFRKTGWRHDSIADLSDSQMTVLEQVDPWVSRAAPAEKAAA